MRKTLNLSKNSPVIYTPRDSAKTAISTLGLGNNKPPNLVKIGLEPCDRTLGGLYPETAGSLVMDQGVGKSSTVLAASIESKDKHGIVTIEDPVSLWGTRLLAYKSGVNALKITKKELTKEELAAVMGASEALEGDSGVLLASCVGSGLEGVLEAIRALADKGCKLIWVDYIQKIRGVSENRITEVATSFTRCQEAAAKAKVALIAVSQVTGVKPNRMPRAYHVRETKDIANESRFILCGCQPDPDDPSILSFFVEKCTHGGSGLKFQMHRDKSGTLKYRTPRVKMASETSQEKEEEEF